MSKRTRINETNSTIDLDVVLEELRQADDEGLTLRELGDLLDLNRAERKALDLLLNRLQGIGLLRRNGQAFRLSPARRALIGRVRQRRRRTISFIPEEIEARAQGRIAIEPEDANGAYDGDRVIVSVTQGRRDGPRLARVEMIVARGSLNVIGRLQHGYRQSWVESMDEKFPFEIDLDRDSIAETGAAELEDGWIVKVEVTDYPAGRANARGRIVQALGASSEEPGMDIEIVIHKHGLPHVFPDEVLAEAEAISETVSEEQTAGRLDLRDVPTVTIDGETARDFDDAITLARLDNGHYELGVHIADVSHYVEAGAPLDAEARLRGTSVYFPERAIPMLPERLSNGICSLNPHVDRLTMSAVMEVNPSGRVVKYELRESVIRSRARMTYTDVNKILSGDAATRARYTELLGLFEAMEELARILIKMRERRGAIDFNLPESVFEFNDEGRITGVLRAERNIAHRIIEEFMLLANETVASHFAKLKVPSVYRIHEEPQPQRVVEFAELAAAYGYAFPAEGVSSKDYQRLSHQIAGKPEERVLSYSMLRSLQRARYTARNVGHFGLAAPVYTHFTSPIRRYPDLIVHRLLREVLQRPKHHLLTLSELELIAEESSDRERAADAAEQELDDWRKAVFMAERVGQEFEGLITSVRDFGFYVELDEFFIEGMVPVSSLHDDYYLFDERRHALVGRQRRRQFRLGDRVRVRVERVNVDRHLVDFAVVDANQSKGRSKAHAKHAE